MSFADLVTDMTTTCFAHLGEAAVYTPPGGGASVAVRATLDEPVEEPFARDFADSPFRERQTSVWLPRIDDTGAAFSPAKGGTVVITTGNGVVRTVTLVSQTSQDPDRTQWAVREVTA